ncbi:MAG: ComEC/Rec2 family competence protein [Candidatus Kapaibacteriota bacterium]
MEKININSLPLVKYILVLIPSIIIGVFLSKSLLIVVLILGGLSGLILLCFKQYSFAYLIIVFSSGLILSSNFTNFKTLQVQSNFKYLKVKLYGKVTDIISQTNNTIKLRVEGEVNSENFQKFATSVLLDIYKAEKALPDINPGDLILCIANIRLPRSSNLPTDPAEIQIALINEVDFLGKTSDRKIIKIWKNQSKYQQILNSIQKKLFEHLESLFNPQNISFFSALLLGNKTMLEYQQREKFATTGMSHILALSGFHFGILATIVFYIFSFVKNNWIKFLLVSCTILLFLAIVNFPPSGIRATILILAVLYSLSLERKTSIVNSLAFVLLIIFIFSPSTIFNVGFQLSFLAVLGIVLFNQKIFFTIKRFVKFNSKIADFFSQIFATTLSAQIFTAPLVAYSFGYYTFISFFSNLLLLPIFSLAISFGFISLLFSFLSITFAKIFATTADILLSIAIETNSFLAENLKSLVINGNDTVLLSLFISLMTIWLFFSLERKVFIIRFAIFLFAFILLLFNLNQSEKDTIHIFPREKYIAIIIPSKEKTICLLLDRKPHQHTAIDRAMEKYLTNFQGDLWIGVSGNVGIAISDNVKKARNTKILEIPREAQQTISKILIGSYDLFKL